MSEPVAKVKVSESRREVVHWLIKFYPKRELGEEWWEFVDQLIESSTELDSRERGGKIVYWLVETVSELEFSEERREVVYWRDDRGCSEHSKCRRERLEDNRVFNSKIDVQYFDRKWKGWDGG